MPLANLTADELILALPPSEPDLAPDDLPAARAARIAHFDAELVRLEASAAVLEAWRGRLDLFVPPPQPQSLAELVESGRQELRRARLRLDRDFLDRRIELVASLRAEVAR